MAFTAGSVELARANKLGNILAKLFSVFGATGAVGRTGAQAIERQAKKLGFGITGLTTGRGFPPFGTIYPGLLPNTQEFSLEAELQNPRGETMANGITLGDLQGQTVGIFLKKFVRSGADYRAVVQTGITLAKALSIGDAGISANGAFNVSARDRLVFGNNVLIVGGGGGFTAAGRSANIPLAAASSFSAAIGDAFSVETIGITRGTSGVAGSTFENFRSGTVVNAGFTAAIYFAAPAGGSGTFVVS
jgi:hypothetical protein